MAYTVPTAADLKAYYPEFADVADVTVTARITRAATTAADNSWPEAYYGPALIDYAAHTMALDGMAKEDETAKYARAGVTGIRTGQFSANFSDARVAKASGGGLDATRYGQSYKQLLRKAKGGPRVVPAGNRECAGWGPTARQNDLLRLP